MPVIDGKVEVAETPDLLERESELRELAAALDRAAGGDGGVILIEGQAGIGKTRLLREARERAERNSFTVLAARGGELERDFGFGIVRQLLEPAVANLDPAVRESVLSGAAGLASPVLGSAEPAELSIDAAQSVLHGLYWLAANLAERAPLMLAVDDAHWADSPSLRFIRYLGIRLGGMPVAVLIAARTGEPDAEAEVLPTLTLEVEPVTIRPAPLSETASTKVLQDALGTDAGVELCRTCHEASGGNPFLLTELIEGLRQDGREPTAIPAKAIEQVGPERIAASVLLRIGRLAAPAPRLARAIATLGESAELRRAAALAGIDPVEAGKIADGLETAGVLGSERPLRFVHPIVRTAIYEDTPRSERSALHASAAELLSEEGADPESVAAHCLLAEPVGDQGTVEALRAAGGAAMSRGAPEAGVRYLQRALEEPPQKESQADLLLELGSASALAGRVSDAIGQLGRAIEESGTEQQLQAAQILAGVLATTDRAPDAVEVLEAQIEQVAGSDPDLAARLASSAVNYSRMAPKARRRVGDWVERLRDRVSAGDEHDPAVLAAVAAEMVTAGDPADKTAALAERALNSISPAQFAGPDWTEHVADRTLFIAEEFELAHRAIDVALDHARARGSAIDACMRYSNRAELFLRTGQLADAEEDARAARAIATEFGPSVGVAAGSAWLVEALTQSGELAAAESVLEEGSFAGPAAELPVENMICAVLFARGRLRLAQDRPRDAADELLECGRRFTELDEVNPGMYAWRSSAALALSRMGERADAARLAHEELRRARVFGAPRALGVALRGTGLVEGGKAGMRLLEEAARTLEVSPARLEYARALVDLGAAHRRSGQRVKARPTLAEGLGIAHRCGARPLEERALAELRAAGARPRRPVSTGVDALTPSERRVAEMATGGMTNKEIAQGLFVTLRTVEMHLSNAYRKLDISSRLDLPDVLEKA
jgi:DNA-binding CsgD family transcriptional regulator